MRRRRGARFVGTLLVLAGLLVAASVLLRPPDQVATAGPVATAASSSAPSSALTAARALVVHDRASHEGYDRDLFGERWRDEDGNGCDTRNDMLRRDLVDVTTSGGCVVATGTLHDPYSGADIAFQHGADTSPAVQIDHVVALSNAWQTGAQAWDAARRAAFANDPLNLLAVDGPTNEAKSDGDTATWLPPNAAYRCAYVARQVAVKAAYGLWVTDAEKSAMVTVLSGCPSEPVPSAVPAPPIPASAFEGCAQAWAAGAAPIYEGDPRYDPGSDGDGDGIACEHRP